MNDSRHDIHQSSIHPTSRTALPNRRGALLALSLLGAAASCAPNVDDVGAESQSVTDVDDSLRLVTFNLQMRDGALASVGRGESTSMLRERARGLVANLARGDYDVIAFQEVFDEDIRRELRDALSARYPHYVAKAYVDADDDCTYEAIAGGLFGASNPGRCNDSGLMLFSRFPFERLTTSPAEYVGRAHVVGASTTSGWRASSDVGFVRYQDCTGSDCMAEKGAALVRIRHPRSGRIYNTVFTHLQAERGDTIRPRQLDQVRSMIEATLTPAQRSGEELLMVGDFNLNTVLTEATGALQVPSELTTVGRPLRDLFYDPWTQAFDNTPLPGALALRQPAQGFDPGRTGRDGARVDYILLKRAPSGTLPAVCVEHLRVPHDLDVFATANGPRAVSDHFAVAATIAPTRLNGNCGPFGAVSLPTDREMSGSVPTRSMVWYRFDEPGTWSFRLSPDASTPDVAYEVYAASDLSTPRWPVQDDRTEAVYPTGHALDGAATFAVAQGPVYVRVFSTSAVAGARFRFFAHRHACGSQSDACVLVPGASADVTMDPAQQSAWFVMDAESASTGRPQTLTFQARGLPSTGFAQYLSRSASASVTATPTSVTATLTAPRPDPTALSMSATLPWYDAAAAGTYLANREQTQTTRFYYRVVRASTAGAARFQVQGQTDLTALTGVRGGGPMELFVNNRNDDLASPDTVYFHATIDGQPTPFAGEREVRLGTIYHGGWESMEHWLGDVRFTQSLRLGFREYDATILQADDYGSAEVTTLPPGEARRGFQREVIGVGGSGRYHLRYNLEHPMRRAPRFQ